MSKLKKKAVCLITFASLLACIALIAAIYFGGIYVFKYIEPNIGLKNYDVSNSIKSDPLAISNTSFHTATTTALTTTAVMVATISTTMIESATIITSISIIGTTITTSNTSTTVIGTSISTFKTTTSTASTSTAITFVTNSSNTSLIAITTMSKTTKSTTNTSTPTITTSTTTTSTTTTSTTTTSLPTPSTLPTSTTSTSISTISTPPTTTTSTTATSTTTTSTTTISTTTISTTTTSTTTISTTTTSTTTTSTTTTSTTTTSTTPTSTMSIFTTTTTSTTNLNIFLQNYWPFNNNLNDVIGGNNLNDGNSNGVITFTADRLNNAFSALSMNNQFTRSNSFTFNSVYFTITVWTYNTRFGGGYTSIFYSSLSGFISVYGVIWFGFSSTGIPSFGISDSSGSYGSPKFVQATNPVNLNQWNHLAVTVSNTQATIYVNGVQVAQGTVKSTVIVSRTGNNWIGRDYDFTDPYYYGYLDELKIFTKALSASEILQVYNS